jgi:oligopeptidase A
MAIDFQIKDLETRVKSILDDSKKLIQQAENGKTWEEVFTPLDTMDEILGRETALQSHLNSVCFSDEFNAEYEKTLPLLSNFYSELGSNENLYSAFNNIDKSALNEQQNYILKNVLRDFKLSGIGLSADKKAKYSELSSKLSLLSNEFAKNSLQATNAYTKKVDKKRLKRAR